MPVALEPEGDPRRLERLGIDVVERSLARDVCVAAGCPARREHELAAAELEQIGSAGAQIAAPDELHRQADALEHPAEQHSIELSEQRWPCVVDLDEEREHRVKMRMSPVFALEHLQLLSDQAVLPLDLHLVDR